MHIRVKSIHGRDEQFEVSPEDTIQHLQELCTAKFNADASRMRLIFRGRHLGDLTATLSSVGISDGLVVHLVERPPNIEPIPVDPAEQNRPRRRETSNLLRDILSRLSGGPTAPEGLMMGMPSVDDPRDLVVQRTVTLRGSRLTQNRENVSELQRIAQLAINQMDFLSEEMRNSIEARWQGNSLRITIPPFSNPHVAAPSMERVHTVDGIFHYLRHYRSILAEDNRFVLLIDSILNGARPDNSYLIEQARMFADRLENVQRVPLRRGAGELDDESPNVTGRFQNFGANGTGGVMRHVLDTDLVELLEELWDHQRWLEPFIIRYRQLLSSRMLFDINDRENLATDGRANIICVYFEHMQQTLHRIAHATHVLSDLNVHLHDPLPRRLYPQFAHFHVAPGSRGELVFQVVDGVSASGGVSNNAGNILHIPAPGTDPLLHPDGRPTLMTLFPTGIGVVHQVAAMVVEASITVDSDGEMEMEEEPSEPSQNPLENAHSSEESHAAESSVTRPLTVSNRTENIQSRLAQYSSIRNMDTTILRRLAVDIHGLHNRANSNSDSGNIYEDLFRSLIAAIGLSDGSADISQYLRNESNANPTSLLQSLLQFLNDGIVNRVVSSDLTSLPSTNHDFSPGISVSASQAAANLFGQRLGNISFPASSMGLVSPDRLEFNRRGTSSDGSPSNVSATSSLRSVRSAPNIDERLAGFGIHLPGNSAVGGIRMPTMEDFQGITGAPFSTQAHHEQFIPLDPFLLCNSRFSRLRGEGRNRSHYEQVTQGHLTRRPIRPPPQEYVDLRVNRTNDGVLLFDDDEHRLIQFVQLSIRSLIAQMHERDGNRTARGSPPVNNVLQQIQSLQESSMPSEQMMLGSSIGVSVNGEIPSELAHMIPAGLRSRLLSSGIRSNPSSSRSHAGAESQLISSQRAANIMSSIPNILTGNTRTEAQSAPSAKKRKANESMAVDNVPSTSRGEIVRRNVFPSNWRSTVEHDTSTTSMVAPLSRGYVLGLPSHLRNVAGGGNLPRNPSVGGVASNLHHLTVGMYDPQDDDLS